MSGFKTWDGEENPVPSPTPEPVPTPVPSPTPAPVPTPEPAPPSEPSEGKIPASVIEALSLASVSTIAMSTSIAMANLYQHQINHARRLDSIAEASLGALLLEFVSPDPVEALSVGKLFQGEADSSIASLLAQLSVGQQAGKIAQSTPGDIGLEINKLGSAIASLQGLVTQLTNVLKSS